MPTARPSIVESDVAVDVRSVKPLARVIPSMLVPTPMIAVSSGRPAASSEPNVTVRTSMAISTPRASPIGASLAIGAAEPPNSTCFAVLPAACAMASVCVAETSASLIVNWRSV